MLIGNKIAELSTLYKYITSQYFVPFRNLFFYYELSALHVIFLIESSLGYKFLFLMKKCVVITKNNFRLAFRNIQHKILQTLKQVLPKSLRYIIQQETT